MVTVIFKAQDPKIRISTRLFEDVPSDKLPTEDSIDITNRQGSIIRAVDPAKDEVIGKVHVYIEDEVLKVDGEKITDGLPVNGIIISPER